MKRVFFYAITFLTCTVWAQTYDPSYKCRYAISNDSNAALTNQKVRFVLNTLTPINAGKMQPNGNDIRFSADSCNPSNFYTYWIQSGMNTSNTEVWVNIPYLPADSSIFVILWYGDPNAPAQSDFNQTFPSQFFTNGNDTTLSGSITYDWFQVDSGDVIDLVQGSSLSISASVIVINGTINANGKGYSAPIAVGNGNGPGGGLGSINAGAGGGSYGGTGGTGGMDPNDTPGSGGSLYDAMNSYSISMGSSGGSTDNAMGGNGGGKISLYSALLKLNGILTTSGNNGGGYIGRCGGGGSGGGILLMADAFVSTSSASLISKGGNGGNGASPAHDGGGGGAGGRIKIFHSSSMYAAHNLSLLGGSGGLYGSYASATPGGNGTYFDSTFHYPIQIFQISAEVSLTAEIIDLDSIFCLTKDSIHLYAQPPGGWFNGPGVFGNYFNPFSAGVGVHQITYEYFDIFGCPSLYDTATVEVLNIPTISYAFNNGPICEGQTLQLNSGEPGSTYYWAGPNGFTSTNQNPTIPVVPGSNSGTYTVVITNPSGCTSSVTTNAIVQSAPEATVTNTSPICINTELAFLATGGMYYTWTGPNGFNSFQANPTLSHAQPPAEGVYTVTVSGVNGCTSTVTTMVDIQDCYNGLENIPGLEAYVYPNPATDYAWVELKNADMVNDLKIHLYDMHGKEVFLEPEASTVSDNRIILNVATLNRGVYILMLEMNGHLATTKIQKE